MSPAGHRVRAGDSKRRMYSRLGKRKLRPLQSSSNELRHLWISHKNYHSRGKKLIKSQTTGEGPLVKSVFESIFSSKGSTPALGSTSLPTVLFTRPNCWHLWKRHKKGGIFSLSSDPLEISSNSNVQSDFKKQVGNDTVEGIAFSKDTAVIMTGVFVEEDEVGGGGGCYVVVKIIAWTWWDCWWRWLKTPKPGQVDWSCVNRMGRWYKPWFYHHVKTFLQKGDQVPTSSSTWWWSSSTTILTGWVHPNTWVPPAPQQALLLVDSQAFAMGS